MLLEESPNRNRAKKTDWDKISAIATVVGAVATVLAAFAGMAAVYVYIRQANIAEKGLSEPYRVALMQKLYSICSDFNRVYPGIEIESSTHGLILIEESLSDLPLEDFKKFQKRMQSKAIPLMADAEILANASGTSAEREFYGGLAGELERFSFTRTGVPSRYHDGQVWLSTFRRDCRDDYYSLLRLPGIDPTDRIYRGEARVMSIEAVRRLDPNMLDPSTEPRISPHPAFTPDLLIDVAGGS